MFEGKTALVTGASTGIGQAISEMLAKSHARVGLIARNNPRLETVRSRIADSGGKAQTFPADLRDPSDIDRICDDALGSWERIDFLVHAAGVWHNEDTVYAGHDLVETPAEQIREVLDVGITAPMLLTRRLLPAMIEHRSGKVLSISGTFASGGAGWLHYYVSKLALEHFTAGLADELRKHLIQVNCICPSDTDTPALRRFFPEDAESALSVDAVSQLAEFLLSSRADHITGQVVVIKSRGD